MNEDTEFDIIIAGGGLSGLSFLHEILSMPSFKEKKILVIDVDRKYANDRTWSFWDLPDYNIPDIPSKKWKYGKVIDKSGITIDFNFEPFVYQTIRSSDFYQFVYEQAKEHPNVVFHFEEILTCHNSGFVECTNGRFKGKLIIKSYYDKDKFSIPKNSDNILLWQHFKGWIIKTPHECFHDDRVTLMDYRIATGNLNQFIYILPFSKTEALVEYTEFSNRNFKEVDSSSFIKSYISDNLLITDYKILDEEVSSIPMTDYIFRPIINGKVINIGTNAGYVKPSSGYCFTRTIFKIRNLVKLLDTNMLREKNLMPKFSFWVFDSILLESFTKGVITGQDVYLELFRKQRDLNRVHLIFKFLDENTSFKENVKILYSMPKKLSLTIIFLKCLILGKYFRKFYL